MIEATIAPAQEKLLKRFTEIGGCVDYVILDCDPGQDVLTNETHRVAAITALEIIGKRWDAYAAKTSKEQNIPRSQFMSMRIDYKKANAMVGKRMSDRDFLGEFYDYGREELAQRQRYSEAAGYAYAFWVPPYPLYDHFEKKRVSAEAVTELFHQINREILGGIKPESVIFEWPVDWSNYFDAGQDWWGSFLWTLANPGTHRVCVLGASTTD